jgi:hypothetical protein
MKKLFIIVTILFTNSIITNAQHSSVFIKNNKAIDGYDVVAFYKQNQPVKGIENISYIWNNATWNFSTQENLDSFKSNPQKYAPQFGGYCAYGCSNGYKAPTQIDTWTIVNNKLYFNYNLKVKQSWEKNKEALIPKAEENWNTIKDKN